VQSTGAGDMFTAHYVASRAAGAEPIRAAELASELVARELQKRSHVGSPDPV
jgi:sugar/nucleoside kinase (ribokinase family)